MKKKTLKELEDIYLHSLEIKDTQGQKEGEILVPLSSIKEWVEDQKSILLMFNPISEEIKAKQMGELNAYKEMLERIEELKQIN